MTTLQIAIVAATLVGVGVPAWIFSLGVYAAAKQPRKSEPSQRYFAYQQVLGFIHSSLETGEVGCGAMFAAAIRELREYPEYADLSILYIEEINVNGTKKFDRILESELKASESFLLEARNV